MNTMKKSRSTFQRVLEGGAVLLGLFAPALFVLHRFWPIELFEILAITALTFFYHFAMRLAVGAVVPWLVSRCALSPGSWWFAQKPFEKGLYKRLGVKKWKDKMPTYSPEEFSLERHTLQEIVRTTCVSELVHEAIVPLSFVPLLFTIVWGTFGVFLITSLLAACGDLCFVIMQRYNRPRLVRLLARTTSNT